MDKNVWSRDGPARFRANPPQQKLEVAAVDAVALPDEADQGIWLSSATAILMTDLCGFFALSRGLSAQELIAFLGDYQSWLVPVIQRHGDSMTILSSKSIPRANGCEH